MAWIDVPLDLGEAVDIYATVRWHAETGWSLSIRSRTAWESWQLADGSVHHGESRYERLTLTELLDVLDCESERRRGF